MATAAEHIEQISSKTARLIRVADDLRRSLAGEKNRTVVLKKEMDELRVELHEARQRELLYKAALNELSGKDKKELEKKISTYLKTIDRVVTRLGHASNE